MYHLRSLDRQELLSSIFSPPLSGRPPPPPRTTVFLLHRVRVNTYTCTCSLASLACTLGQTTTCRSPGGVLCVDSGPLHRVATHAMATCSLCVCLCHRRLSSAGPSLYSSRSSINRIPTHYPNHSRNTAGCINSPVLSRL
jgi:hypothetical protein